MIVQLLHPYKFIPTSTVIREMRVGNRLLLQVIHNYLCTNACLLMITKCMKILGDNSCMLELEPSNLIRTPFNFETHRIFVQKLNVKLDT